MPVEALLVPWLAAQLGIRVVTELPDDLQLVAPLARITAIGGSADPDNPRFTSPRVALDWFAAGYGPAAELAERGGQVMHTLAGTTLLGTPPAKSTVTKVQTVSLPAWVPYPDTALRHFVSSFQLHVMNR